MKRKNNASLIDINLHSPSLKKGASPGAIMNDELNNKIMVKLSIPPAQEKFKISNLPQVDNFVANLSKAACYEQLFFNLAKKIANDKLEVPQTFLTMLKPFEYDMVSGDINLRSVSNCLGKKFSIKNFELNKEIIIDYIKNSEIAHICSVMLENYHDLSDCFPNLTNNLEKGEKTILPSGIGAFFAFNACMGNNDCIGSQGTNAGFNVESDKIILVDGGNYRFNPARIDRIISVADNNALMLSFDMDLSQEEQKNACEVFMRFASLNESELRSLITEDEKYINCNFLSEKDVKLKIAEIKLQQQRVVEVFYNDMIAHELEIPMRIIEIANKIETDDAMRASYDSYEHERSSNEGLSLRNSNSSEPDFPMDVDNKWVLSIENQENINIDNYEEKENTFIPLQLNKGANSSLLSRRKNLPKGLSKLEILPTDNIEQSITPKRFEDAKRGLKIER